MVLLSCGTYSLPIAAPTWSALMKGHQRIVWSVAFHPISSLLATGSYDSTVNLCLLTSDGSNGTCTATLKGHCDGVTSVAFYPSLQLLASGSYDSTVKL
jgi:WD40 repeat protein